MTLRYQVAFVIRSRDDADCIHAAASLMRRLAEDVGAKVGDDMFSRDETMRLVHRWKFHAGDSADPAASVFEAVGRLTHIEFEDTIYGSRGGSVGRLPPK